MGLQGESGSGYMIERTCNDGVGPRATFLAINARGRPRKNLEVMRDGDHLRVPYRLINGVLRYVDISDVRHCCDNAEKESFP